MYALRKWMFKPKKSDASILAQFFHADEALNHVAAELDSFDGRKDPERCTALVNKLRHCQDKVLVVVEKIIQQAVPDERESRDFRVKFPDDVLQESLAGQLWFGAECLAAGSSIMNREVESASMRPLAKSLTRQLDHLRSLLRDQCLRSQSEFTDKIKEALLVFDKLFAEFELGYVSAMVPVKTMKEYDMLQEVTVLFCETVQRALQLHLLNQEMIDYYDPALMFTIPRLAIICGLLIYPEGPINPDKDPMNMSEMFRPFQMLLYKIRELLWTLSRNELWLLEKALSSTDDNVPLTDKAFEEQLNRLNILEQKRHRATVHHNTNSAEHSALEEPDQGIMSHSPSTQTVVTISNHGNGETCSDKRDHGDPYQDQLLRVRKQDRIPHQESCDSGNLSMSDQVGSEAACKLMTVDEARGTTRTLRKSQSWPERRRSRSSSKNARCQRQSSSGDCQEFLSSVELLDGCQGDENVQRVMCTQSMGSREFCFHLPHNTSLQEATSSQGTTDPCEKPVDPVKTEEAQNQTAETDSNGVSSAQQIMYTQNGCDQTDKDIDDGSPDGRQAIHPHIAFITGALNNVFLMDPEFQGVAPPVIYDPPIPQLSPGTSAGGKGHANKSRKRTSGKSKRKSKHCDINACVSGSGQVRIQTHQVSCDTRENRHQPTHHCANNTKVQTSTRGSSDPNLKVLKYADVVSAVRGDVEDPEELSSSPGSCDGEWDRESYCSSDTSSYASEAHDDEEIALAIHAAEMAARKDARARYKTSSELIHKLFVCISGVADQLQTNYASDFRHILKSVFECHSSDPDIELEHESCKDKMADTNVALQSQSSTDSSSHSSQEADSSHSNTNTRRGAGEQTTPASSPSRQRVDPAEAAEPAPDWIPDDESLQCSGCEVPFSFVRRRHHCRNCGKIFCGRCSSNNVPLPHYGHCKPVRVCNHCFMFQVTPFTA